MSDTIRFTNYSKTQSPTKNSSGTNEEQKVFKFVSSPYENEVFTQRPNAANVPPSISSQYVKFEHVTSPASQILPISHLPRHQLCPEPLPSLSNVPSTHTPLPPHSYSIPSMNRRETPREIKTEKITQKSVLPSFSQFLSETGIL